MTVAVLVLVLVAVAVLLWAVTRFDKRSRQAIAELVAVFRDGVAASRLVGDQDRAELKRLTSAAARLEAAGAAVASDLAASHRQADQADSDVAGTAADAGARTPPPGP